MRSASSFARFSASSKSMMSPVSFFAPSLVVTFLAPRMLAFLGPAPVVLRSAAECVILLAAGLVSEGLARPEDDRDESLPLEPTESGEAVRPITGGVAVREIGGVGRLMAGLSQEEKKSSSGSPAGVELPWVSPSVITTSLGYLFSERGWLAYHTKDLEPEKRHTPPHPWQPAS